MKQLHDKDFLLAFVFFFVGFVSKVFLFGSLAQKRNAK